MKRLLVITPDLSLNGANVVLLELLEAINDRYNIHVISTEEGEFGLKLNKLNISYEVHSSVDPDRINVNDYDEVFLNTSSVHFYALLFQNTNVKVHWWFHESIEQLSKQQINFVHLGLLSRNFNFYGVTPKVVNGLKELYGVSASLLPMLVKDLNSDEHNNGEYNTVFIPGAYTYIKGQDILLAAISKLPPDILNSYKFVFAGYKLPMQEEYYNKIKEISEKIPGVIMLDSISREEVYDYYKESVCVVAPSRVDSTPTTIVEALMFGKLCIVSSGAGISELMTDCVNGFVYPVNDVDELYKRLLLVLSDYNSLGEIEKNARKIYEKYFMTKEYIDEYLKP